MPLQISQPHRRTLPRLPGARLGRGFTITEILVVIGIIVLIAALAVPAINVLSGSRSIDGATNTIAAMLGRARQEALSRQQEIGLAIFEDASRERVGLALVAGPQPWQDGVNYLRGDFVYADQTNGVRRYFLCHTAHTSRQGAAAGDPDHAPVFPDSSTDAWTPVESGSDPEAVMTTAQPAGFGRRYPTATYISILPETDIVYLPPGVGAQVLNSSRTRFGNAAAQSDRYLGSSVIFFDPNGRLSLNRQFGIMYNAADSNVASGDPVYSSRLGLAIQFNRAAPVAGASTNIDPNTLGASALQYGSATTSGLGVILFDRQGYRSQGFPRWDAQLVEQAYATAPTGYSKSEKDAEDWLDTNGTLLMVNRYNGTLLKAE